MTSFTPLWYRNLRSAVTALSARLIGAPTSELTIWWLSGLGGGIFLSLLKGLHSNEAEMRIIPNQGIQHSITSSLAVALFGGLLGGLIGSFGGLGPFAVGLIVGLLIGLIAGQNYGSTAAIRHYTLRYLLYRQGSLPFLDLIPWLDHCCDRLFLRRVGGGYIFIHRMLLEHFARKYEEQTK